MSLRTSLLTSSAWLRARTLPSGRRRRVSAGRSSAPPAKPGQGLLTSRGVEHDLVGIEIDRLDFLPRALGCGDIRTADLADDLAGAGGEFPWDRQAVLLFKADDLKIHLEVGLGGRQGAHGESRDVSRHVDLVSRLAPGAKQLGGLGVDAGADVIAVVVRVKDDDPHAITVVIVGTWC